MHVGHLRCLLESANLAQRTGIPLVVIVNGDGFLDLVTLDAGEQSLGVLSFSEGGKLLPMTRFRVFETRLFQAGEPREFEPSMALIGDFTGDGANDIVLLCHDRMLLYPQSPKPTKSTP